MKKARKVTDPDVKILEDAIINRYVRLISVVALLGLGVWMLIAPDRPGHQAIEKGSVFILKEIWSFEAGIAFIVLAIAALTSIVLKLRLLQSATFIKIDAGYFLFENKKRLKGLTSVRDLNDLIVFDRDNNKVYNLQKYYKVKNNKFKKVLPDSRYNCEGPYWSGNNDGFTFFYKGQNHSDLDIEKRENDLVVSLPDNGGKFFIKDYSIHKDKKIRPVEFY